MMGDPLAALAEIIVGLHRTKTFGSWFRLVFGMMFSYCAAFSSAMGAALLTHSNYATAIGSGLLAGTSAACFLFYVSPLTKDIMISLPKDVKMADPNEQTFLKTK